MHEDYSCSFLNSPLYNSDTKHGAWCLIIQLNITGKGYLMRKITLYIGLNDKDTKTQKISTLDAYAMVCNTLKVDATISEARGVYTHADGTIVFETSLVVELLDFDDTITNEWLKRKTKTLKEVLNQESVAVQVQDIDSELM